VSFESNESVGSVVPCLGRGVYAVSWCPVGYPGVRMCNRDWRKWRACASRLCQNKTVTRSHRKVRMAVVCLMGVIALVPAGAFAFAVSALPSTAKRLLPILACQRCAARLLVGTGGPIVGHM